MTCRKGLQYAVPFIIVIGPPENSIKIWGWKSYLYLEMNMKPFSPSKYIKRKGNCKIISRNHDSYITNLVLTMVTL